MTTTDERIEHDVQELDRVTIRFAGDSGDGMQLTGTQFTRTAAVFGNDVSTFPDYPRRDSRPRGLAAGRVRVPDQLLGLGHLHPGRRAGRARGDEPGGAQDEHRRPAGGRRADRQQRRVHPAEPQQGGLRDEPARPTARSSTSRCSRSRSAASTSASLDGLEMTSKQKDLTKNFFALGLMFWLYERSMDPTIALDRPEVRRAADRRRGEHAGAQGRLRVRRDDRDVPHDVPRPEGEAAPRARTATSRATRRRASAS